MYSKHIKSTQKKLAQLINDILYPAGSSWTDIATLVRNSPNIRHYTLSELEDRIGQKGFSTLITVLRLSMPPYNLFETTFELITEQNGALILSLDDYQKLVLNGGMTTSTGRYIDVDTVNRQAVIHLQVIG